MRASALVSVAVVALSSAGCGSGGDPVAASVVIGNPSMLAPGDTMDIQGVLRLRFDAVVNDSRCAVDVVCVTAGDAVVRVSLGFINPAILAPIVLLELHAGPPGPASAAAYGYRVTLRQLDPEPRAGVAIAPGDYRAEIEIATDAASAGQGPVQ